MTTERIDMLDYVQFAWHHPDDAEKALRLCADFRKRGIDLGPRFNGIGPKKPSLNYRKEWTKQECEAYAKMLASDMTPAEAAAHDKRRTESAIRNAISTGKIKLPEGKGWHPNPRKQEAMRKATEEKAEEVKEQAKAAPFPEPDPTEAMERALQELLKKPI